MNSKLYMNGNALDDALKSDQKFKMASTRELNFNNYFIGNWIIVFFLRNNKHDWIQNCTWMVPYNVGIFIRIGNPRWPPVQDLIFNKGFYGKMNKSFFLESTNIILQFIRMIMSFLASCKPLIISHKRRKLIV